MQAREAAKAENELVGCTFTPDIGRKGIIYQTMNNDRFIQNRNQLLLANGSKDLESTGGSQNPRNLSAQQKSASTLRVSQELVRPADQFYTDMLESKR